MTKDAIACVGAGRMGRGMAHAFAYAGREVRLVDAKVRSPDAFARLEAEGLSPTPDADRGQWLRRVTLDLTGLPPTPEEIDAFLADEAPGAHERVVDRLLASPRHGERMAQHWLDVVRYADTHGYEVNTERANAWPYRDWVVAAFNADMPYDTFVRRQLAGDADRDDAATGFLVTAAVLLPGQIGAEPPRLFQIYAEGNFIEATDDTPFFQIGEHKYGKPILDRVAQPEMRLGQAAKLILLSFDSTLRSNLSVGMPIDLLVYERDSLDVRREKRIGPDDEYFRNLSGAWSTALRQAFANIEEFKV